MPELEGPMEYITLGRASALCNVSAATLRNQALRGRLRVIKPGHDMLTTRVWLHRYLHSRDTRGHAKPLPPDYVAPE
jgi:hypothetical protein